MRGGTINKTISFAALLLFLVSGASMAAQGQPFAETGDCVSNCATTVDVGPMKFVVARDAQGQIFEVVRLDLGTDAELVESDTSQIPLQANEHGTLQDKGGTVDQKTETYVTTTEVVVVTTTFYYNAQGELEDIDVNETRFPRETEEQ